MKKKPKKKTKRLKLLKTKETQWLIVYRRHSQQSPVRPLLDEKNEMEEKEMPWFEELKFDIWSYLGRSKLDDWMHSGVSGVCWSHHVRRHHRWGSLIGWNALNKKHNETSSTICNVIERYSRKT